MNRLTIVIVLLFLFSSCISNRYIKRTPFKNTLLFRNQDSISFYPGNKVTLWKPTKQDLQLAESLMQAYIDNNKKLSDLNSYTRQYIGIIDNHKKVVLIEGFCVPPKLLQHLNWKKERVRVDDGGDCFFRIKVDLDTRKCYGFGVNAVG